MKVRIVRIASLAIALSLTVVSGLSAQTKSAPAQKAAAPKAEKWTGTISDSMCGKSHGANGGTVQKDHDCTAKCVKDGSQYVFVAGDKVYKIANQKFAGLDKDAGQKLTVEGTMKGDVITVTKVTVTK